MPIINQDGKSYDFQPGRGGSLTVHGEPKPVPAIQANEPVSKTVGPNKGCRSCSGNIPPAATSCPNCGDVDSSYGNALDHAHDVKVGSVRG